MADITTAAQSTIAAYAAAVAKGSDATAPISEVVSAMAKFYLPAWTSFTLGMSFAFKDDESTQEGIHDELTRLQSMGLGTDIHLENARVEPISDLSAACWLTWILKPKDEAPWRFTIVYGFRIAPDRPDGLVGGWEWVNSDQEYAQLLARNPRLFS
ncbi:hypothetical protein B0H67DRAFT_583102 [Lasiosphaeris hirsuta]|uniref:Uncharacterized protein n=1 Tax=Lasiosphaeris hirsuta TaxID=260670 RepID=A0AA40DRJ0_9PEZI|nr:hypothetical protein B0H67DRAFT_583102 [Lasiosphaeris hirsuta]